MSASEAEIGYGVLLKMLTSASPVTYTTLGRQRDVMPPDGFSVDLVDATHNESDDVTEEVIPGIIRTKSITLEIEYKPLNAAVQLIQAAKRVKKTFRSVWPDGRYIEWDGYIEDFEAQAPTEDKQIATLTIKRTGLAVANAASVPSNLILPAISGIAQVGVTLTAFEGVWANEPVSFTYQWYAASASPPAAIVGATSRTYVPVSGDEGNALSVVVTGTNSAGSAAATSATTEPVLAE
jgi:hypothetical protein